MFISVILILTICCKEDDHFLYFRSSLPIVIPVDSGKKITLTIDFIKQVCQEINLRPTCFLDMFEQLKTN